MRNKVLIITGSTGIAAETIKLAAGEGAKIFFASRTEQNCKELNDELAEMGAESHYLSGDLTDPDFAVNLVHSCIKEYNRIDALYNVAGISGRRYGDGPVHECTEEGWEKTITTNVTTQYRMCREVVRQMLRQDPDEDGLRGTILNMSSILGISPEPKYFSTIAYAAAKGAIISMSKSMASRYAPDKIRVNVIAPALAFTNMSARASQDNEIINFMKVKQPLTGTMMSALDVAKASLFLLSNESKVLTGEILKVDAGWSISG